MGFTKPSIPHIHISLAPPEEPQVEPYSPFGSSNVLPSDDDAFRHTHLTPPPSSTRFGKSLSPLRPVEAVSPVATGLERDRFDMLLKASRERHAAVGAKKAQDLRKEIALKAHKTKQVERRALFLSKVLAPPSPTAVSTPKTPPDSPAIFHYSLPSPGLVSPLSMFESLEDGSCDPYMAREPWVEQVDFRLPDHLKTTTLDTAPKVSLKGLLPQKSKSGKPIPSLDQISARLSINGQMSAPTMQFEPSRRSSTRFPAFLQTKPLEPDSLPEDETIKAKPRLAIGVGRLQMPVRTPPINSPKPIKAEFLPPLSPRSPVQPNLTITTLVVPRSSTTSPTKLSESNLLALESRGRMSRGMYSAFKRPTSPSDDSLTGYDEKESEEEKKKWRRQSCPPELGLHKARGGFEHPVLTLPGAF